MTTPDRQAAPLPSVQPSALPAGPPRVGRRAALAVGALAAGGVLAACTTEPDRPDPLLPLLAAARTDAATARAAEAQYPSFSAAKTIAAIRTEHAEVLQREIRRASTQTSTAKPAPAAPANVSGGQSAAQQGLRTSLRDAQRAATALVPAVPSYRAGMLGSVAAGCASLLEGMS